MFIHYQLRDMRKILIIISRSPAIRIQTIPVLLVSYTLWPQTKAYRSIIVKHIMYCVVDILRDFIFHVVKEVIEEKNLKHLYCLKLKSSSIM